MRMLNPLLSATLCSALAATLLLWPAAASAQAPALDEASKNEMLGYIREANEHFKAERWDSALELYAKAYAISPQPPLLYRLGKSAEGAGKLRVALDYYQQFVDALPNEDVSKTVAQQIPVLRAKIPPTLKVVTNPSRANVYIGPITGQPVGSTPYDAELELGEVTVTVKLDGYRPFSKSYTFEGAEQELLDVTLLKESNQVSVVAPVSEPSSGGSAKKLVSAGWVTTAVGLAGLGAGGAFTALKSQAVNEVNDYDRAGAPNPAQARTEIAGVKDRADAHWRNSVIFFTVGGVLTAAGVGLVTAGKMRDASSDSAEPGDTAARAPRKIRLDFGAASQGAQLGLSGSF